MIVPVVSESEWLSDLHDVPLFSVPSKPLLVIAPHPDDETLGAGGLIARQRLQGIDVLVAAVTDGERAFPGAAGLATARRKEQAHALDRLGASENSIIRFGLPDGAVESHENELVAKLTSLISADTHVVAPWRGDFHADHGACGRAAKLVASRAGATLTWYFFWTWHFGTRDFGSTLQLRRLPLSAELLRAKTEALLCHASQVGSSWGDPILPESLLGPARRPFEIFAIT